ncbi:MAG: hypothetical protein J0H57_18290 [Rhodospirillales bacterium]|nr:hypothetical protein [Rhodospirillales bacterium]
MRSFLIPTIAAAGLLALPAFSTASLAATPSNSTGSSSSQSMNGSNAANGANTAEIQQSLKQDLSKAGYTDIQIIPGSFLVHAKDSKGHPTQMVVTPNSVTSVTAMSGSQNSSGTNSTTKQ